MATPTIAYVEKQNRRGQKLTSFMVNDLNALEQLTGLTSAVKQSKESDVVAVESHINFAIESFSRTVSMENMLIGNSSANQPSGPTTKNGLISRLWSMIVAFFKSIANAIGRVWTWITNIIKRSKARRDALAKSLDKLERDVKDHVKKNGDLFFPEIHLAPDQVQYFTVQGQIPEKNSDAVNDLTASMFEYRSSRGLRSAMSIVLSVDEITLRRVLGGKGEEVDIDLLFSKFSRKSLESVFDTEWIKPTRKGVAVLNKSETNTTLEHVRSLIGDSAIIRQIPSNRSESVTKIGYLLMPDLGDQLKVDENNRVIQFETLADFYASITATRELLEECEHTSKSMKEVEKIIKRVFQIEDFVTMFKPQEGLKAEDQVVIHSLRAFAALTRSLTNFPSSIFAHAVKIASSQTSMLHYAFKQSSKGNV